MHLWDLQVPAAAVFFNRHICAAGDTGAASSCALYVHRAQTGLAVVQRLLPVSEQPCESAALQAVSLIFFLLPNAYILAHGKAVQPRSRATGTTCRKALK
jgi:hypothetical protein